MKPESELMHELRQVFESELTVLRPQLSASALARFEALSKSLQIFQQLEDALQSLWVSSRHSGITSPVVRKP
jgi:hypothetical protein